jgi:hypothetical protein
MGVLKSTKGMKPEMLIDNMNETEQNISFSIFYYIGFLFTAVGFCIRLSFASYCRISSNSAEVSAHFCSKYVVGKI